MLIILLKISPVQIDRQKQKMKKQRFKKKLVNG
jgi:hypothetical protein